MRILRLFVFSFALFRLGNAAEVPLDDSNSWAFDPGEETFADNALLDLRRLNEAASGETGFIKLTPSGNDFLRGDDRRIRFWAVGTDVYRQSPEAIDRHCRFLAKMGVNLARIHSRVANAKEGANITDVNEAEVEGIFRFIKAAKENGVYVLISPYYGHHPVPKSWDLPDYTGEQPWGALFVEPRMQDAYKQWTKHLYTTVNPHTGLAIKDDPTVAFLQIHNEDSLFFWTQSRMSEAHKKILAKHFGTWLSEKYESLDTALAKWGRSARKHEHDSPADGLVGVFDVYFLTKSWTGGMSRRIKDQVEFMATFQRQFYADMGTYLREELGCQQLLNATNWRTANDSKLKALERYSYHALDFDAENEYVGSDYQHIGDKDSYRIDPGHYLVNESVLFKPLELSVNYRQEKGHPFMVTETSWKNPNRYQSEGPFLISAYQTLNGLDAVFWFSCTDPTWQMDPRRLFWKVGDSHALSKWSCSTPMLMGMFPANAIQHRLGLLEAGKPVAEDFRPLRDLWLRRQANIEDNEIYGDGRIQPELQPGWEPAFDGQINRAAFLVGPVHSRIGGSSENSKGGSVDDYLNAEKGTIRSNTDQHQWDYRQGICRVDAPASQGVTGFLAKAGGRFELSTVTIESTTDYATIQAVALDRKPLSESRRILLQLGTVSRLDGWETKDAKVPFGRGADATKIDGEQIVRTGKPPWRIANLDATITIQNPDLVKAIALTPSGYRQAEVALEPVDGGVKLTAPQDALYVIVRADPAPAAPK